MPDPDWKKRARKDDWRDGDTFNVGIGQGAVLTTPLQLCVMAARLANGGKAMIPHVIRSFGGVKRGCRRRLRTWGLIPRMSRSCTAAWMR